VNEGLPATQSCPPTNLTSLFLSLPPSLSLTHHPQFRCPLHFLLALYRPNPSHSLTLHHHQPTASPETTPPRSSPSERCTPSPFFFLPKTHPLFLQLSFSSSRHSPALLQNLPIPTRPPRETIPTATGFNLCHTRHAHRCLGLSSFPASSFFL
jgi:hypothetical protein